jgi:hypothetical protein
MKVRKNIGESKEGLLSLIVAVASRSNVKMAIGGGLAVNVYGYRRYTSDVDAFFHFDDQKAVLRSLNKKLGDEYLLEELHPSHWIVTRRDVSPDERIDLLFSTDDPEESAIELAETKLYNGVKAPFFPIDLLIISKFLAERDETKDSLDIYELHRKGAYDISEIVTRLNQMGLNEDAFRFPRFMRYLEELPSRKRQ